MIELSKWYYAEYKPIMSSYRTVLVIWKKSAYGDNFDIECYKEMLS